MPLLDASIAFLVWMMVLCVIVKSINTGLKSLFIARFFFSKPIADALGRVGLNLADVRIDPSGNPKCRSPQFAQKHPEEFLSYLEKYRSQVADKPEIFSKINQILIISRGRIRKRMLLTSFLVSFLLCLFLDINAFSIAKGLFTKATIGSDIWHTNEGILGKHLEQFLTACMISVGAPYWHDILEKFITFKKEMSR